MIKKLGILAATTAVVFSMGSAHAEDTGLHNWGGLYGGATVGATSFKTDTADYWCWYACDAPGNSEVKLSGGLTGGYNWQLSDNFVVGIEADISTGAKSSETINYREDSGDDGVTWDSKWSSLATVRGRAGLAVDRTMVFVTGGLAIAKAKYDAQSFYPAYPQYEDRASWDGNLTGLVVGVGVEHALTKNMSLKAEYLHVAMPKKSACWRDDGDVCQDEGAENDDTVHWTTSADMFRVGMNWKF